MAIYPHAVFISVKKKVNIDVLLERLLEFKRKSNIETELIIPEELQNLVSFLHEKAEILEEKYDSKNKQNVMRLQIPRKLYPGVLKQIKNYRLLEYINK